MVDFEATRAKIVERYRAEGYIKTERMARAMMTVKREGFMDSQYIEYAYYDQPFPIPGDGRQTISAPYMYPIFYEALEVNTGESVLEVGTGSGYGAALAKELVGSSGKVVSIEINEVTIEFARSNLIRSGYGDIILVLGDGSQGWEAEAPYDKVCITASCPDVPPPLVQQLKEPGRLIAPVGAPNSLWGQELLLMSKERGGKTNKKSLMQVVYVPLQGKFGWVPK